MPPQTIRLPLAYGPRVFLGLSVVAQARARSRRGSTDKFAIVRVMCVTSWAAAWAYPTCAPWRRARATVPAMARSLDAHVRDLADSLGIADVELRRSQRRRRTVSVFREGGRVIISAPARISSEELLPLAQELLGRLIQQAQGRTPTDEQLAERARRLAARWLPPGFPEPSSVRWTTAQSRVWGTCVNAEGSIRLSHRLRAMPDFVIDYVLLHELAHLMHHGHGQEFEALLAVYPDRDRARGFLDGVTWQSQQGNADYLAAQQMDLFDA